MFARSKLAFPQRFKQFMTKWEVKLLRYVGSHDNLHPPNLRKTMVMGLNLGIDYHSSLLALEGKV
jgi:hypothetical protein